MPKKRLTTNGNVFKRADGRWQSVIWYFDEQGEKKVKDFFLDHTNFTKNEACQELLAKWKRNKLLRERVCCFD